MPYMSVKYVFVTPKESVMLISQPPHGSSTEPL